MKSENEIKTTFSGNIVELYNTGDKLSAKVLLEPGYLKVSGDELKDTHLGDQVDVTCEFICGGTTHRPRGPRRP